MLVHGVLRIVVHGVTRLLHISLYGAVDSAGLPWTFDAHGCGPDVALQALSNVVCGGEGVMCCCDAV
jgi:hypothetical protein